MCRQRVAVRGQLERKRRARESVRVRLADHDVDHVVRLRQRRRLVGSVAEQIVRLSRRPTLIIPTI
jgi:nucleotide-binding universal stress UspA family protein